MKTKIITVICIAILLLTTVNISKISDFIANKISSNPTLIIKDKNPYAKEKGYMFVDISKDFIPYSYNDLLNIIYTTVNNGWDSFTFYCPQEYHDCINDMDTIIKEKLSLTHLNNYVHPFNSFSKIKTSFTTSGEITIKIVYLYSDDEIEMINEETDRILKEVTNNTQSNEDKIKAVHDYIINHTKYDVERNDNEDSPYKSYSAYGTLFQHMATCSGYTDTMAIFLTKMGFDNFKVATTPDSISYKSTGHVWNAVYINNEWKHLDLTWDDPVSDNGQDYLYHKYFLINTNELKNVDAGDVKVEEHNFNQSIYLEFNDSIK